MLSQFNDSFRPKNSHQIFLYICGDYKKNEYTLRVLAYGFIFSKKGRNKQH